MIEVSKGLFVGSQDDEARVRGALGWFVIHACKEPYHRQALGYAGRGAPKGHPEYLIANRPGRLILNLVDTDDVAYIPAEIIDAAIEAIRKNLETSSVLVHCNQGFSRSPTIALLYMSKYTDTFRGMSADGGMQAFQKLYPPFAPAEGMANYVRINWGRYAS
jgi:hypothetical protein